MQRQCGKEADFRHKKREGTGESPLFDAAGHFQAVRDDRNGRSRYRAAKMSRFGIN